MGNTNPFLEALIASLDVINKRLTRIEKKVFGDDGKDEGETANPKGPAPTGGGLDFDPSALRDSFSSMATHKELDDLTETIANMEVEKEELPA